MHIFDTNVVSELALQSAKLQVPHPCPQRDALICATALVHNMTIVTRNVVDFEPMAVKTYNPWSMPA
jgi:predicted nucleic acid-binding protein